MNAGQFLLLSANHLGKRERFLLLSGRFGDDRDNAEDLTALDRSDLQRYRFRAGRRLVGPPLARLGGKWRMASRRGPFGMIG
jgi:hypothetical protein